MPTLTSNYSHVTVSGATTGEYTFNASFGTANKTWYVRAYAKNDRGVSYGEVKTFTTPSKPSVGFSGNYESPYNYSAHVTQNAIQLQTNVTSAASLTERGYIYTKNATAAATIPTS